MPPKKATGTTAKKASAPSEHPPYKDMIKEAIMQLKERNGSSRQAIKKYISSNFKGIKESNFDTQFNAALKRGVTAGEFTQPKGPSGPVKLQKKDAAKSTAKATKPASEKVTKKVAPKKTTTSTAKKATSTKAAAKPKSGTKAKTAVVAPKSKKTTATTEKTSLNKAKTGRVSKTATTKVAPKKSAAPKKAAPKKKSEAPAPAATASE